VAQTPELIVEVHGLLLLWAKKFEVSRLATMLESTSIRVATSEYLYELTHLVPLLDTEASEPLVASPFSYRPLRAPYIGDKFADIVFSVKGEKIKAHKAILCARCEYYRYESQIFFEFLNFYLKLCRVD